MSDRQPDDSALRIGDLAARSGVSADTIRYYERLGLLEPPRRAPNGYRLYGQQDLRRLRFIRRAKLLGFSLDAIGDLLGLAGEGECRPLRRQVADLLRRQIAACDAQLAEVAAFKETLEGYYRLALERRDAPACSCATFPANCACLPIQVQEEGAWRP